ncbi:hypothetical protein DSO57_1014141 [Entomophthora muscae]|uniref:Uncharacterized protein n=1 Tax=Entomophthora muscae TaxID=34485 RepID=A0ACC2S7J1_9FUNG|nr:hypothetical protein DSO57_1014141 [Entomophthora muscae]
MSKRSTRGSETTVGMRLNHNRFIMKAGTCYPTAGPIPDGYSARSTNSSPPPLSVSPALTSRISELLNVVTNQGYYLKNTDQLIVSTIENGTHNVTSLDTLEKNVYLMWACQPPSESDSSHVLI